MKYLVTGAAGFIGSNLIDRIVQNGDEVIAIDNFDETLRPASSRRRWHRQLGNSPQVKFIEGDLVDLPLPDLLLDVEVVIHQAATPGLNPSWIHFDRYLHNNVLATQSLAQALVKASERPRFLVKRVVHASTSSVYGLLATGDELEPTKPISPYGISKLASEQVWGAYAKLIPADLITLRYFSVYGPRQRSDMAWSQFIEAILNDEEIQITGDGEQTRSVTYVGDVVTATLQAGNSDRAQGIYNICGDVGISVNEAIKTIETLIGKSAKKTYVPTRLGDQARTQGNNKKAKTELGFTNSTSIQEGLAAQIKNALNERS